jgi:4-hydroxy-tetrahydrodipicolinate synthase
MIINKITGTGVALATPFDRGGEVDFAALERLVQHVAQGGVDYLVALGTTAETPTLSQAEKDEVVACIKHSNTQGLPVVLGIGGNNTSDVIKAIGRTNFDGICALLSVTPYYNKPSQQGLYEHFCALGRVSPVPVILYNVPSRTGANLLPETVLRLAIEPKIVAIKEAGGSIAQAAAILQSKPDDFVVLSGDDGLAVPFMSLGAKGLISVLANAFPSAVSAMVKAAMNNDYPRAAKVQLTLMPIIDACFTEGNPVGVKAALSALGIADSYVRLPLVAASSALTKKMEEIIRNLAFVCK